MTVAKLKDQARRHEQNQEWQKALDLYLKALEKIGEEEQDLALYNRVGDLYMRLGETQRAIEYYESAVDRYMAAGLANNAIALCKKILRNVPGRTSLYLRLGQICAAQGFVTDARDNFLEYAERRQQEGNLDEAFRALKEFADLVPGDTEVRLILARQLEAHGRRAEAAQQLLVVYGARLREGDEAGAAELATRIGALDPGVKLVGAAGWAAAEGEPSFQPAAPVSGELEVELGAPEAGGFELKPAEEVEKAEEAEVGEGLAVGADLGISDFTLAVEGEEEAVPLPTLELGEEEEAAAPLPTFELGAAEAEAGVEEAEEPLPVLEPEAEAAELEVGEWLPLLETGEEEAGPAVAEPVDIVDALRARLERHPDDYDAWVRLGEELLERGARQEGMEALERARRGFADADDLDAALRVTRELLRMNPDHVRLHQKLVEYAFRKNERAELIPAYLGLAACLERTGQDAKARAVYQRVLDIDAGNEDARAGLARIEGVPVGREATGEKYVDLRALVLDEEVERTTRFVVAEEEPSGDEEADFAKMLAQFKSKVSQHVGTEDYSSHYDLGVAFKEMGLLDEAIAEFQQALRGTAQALQGYEMLGQCFLEKGQPSVAVKMLTRALSLPYTVEDELIAIYYYLARSYEALGQRGSAREFYEKVFGLDINFQDVSERLRALQ